MSRKKNIKNKFVDARKLQRRSVFSLVKVILVQIWKHNNRKRWFREGNLHIKGKKEEEEVSDVNGKVQIFNKFYDAKFMAFCWTCNFSTSSIEKIWMICKKETSCKSNLLLYLLLDRCVIIQKKSSYPVLCYRISVIFAGLYFL